MFLWVEYDMFMAKTVLLHVHERVYDNHNITVTVIKIHYLVKLKQSYLNL